MFPALALRILRTTDPRLLGKFAWNFGVKGLLSVEKFKRRIRRGEYFPPFLYLSILNSCNLRCQGCWVDVEAERTQIDVETLNRTINDAKAHGNAFFGILGGEPFMHPELLDLLAAHPDCSPSCQSSSFGAHLGAKLHFAGRGCLLALPPTPHLFPSASSAGGNRRPLRPQTRQPREV